MNICVCTAHVMSHVRYACLLIAHDISTCEYICQSSLIQNHDLTQSNVLQPMAWRDCGTCLSKSATVSCSAGAAKSFARMPRKLAWLKRDAVVERSAGWFCEALIPQAQGYRARPYPFHSAIRSNNPVATRARTVSVLHDVSHCKTVCMDCFQPVHNWTAATGWRRLLTCQQTRLVGGIGSNLSVAAWSCLCCY